MKHSSPDLRHGLYSLGILISVILAFYIILIQPALLTKNENKEHIENLIFQSGKFTRSYQENDLLKDEIDQLKQQNTSNKGFLENKAPAIVAADLQKKLKALVESSGGDLISTHALTPKKDELFQKITVKVHMRTNMNALRDVFYQIAINKPLLFTENILIQKTRANSRARQQTDNQIEVRFDISGYLNSSSI